MNRRRMRLTLATAVAVAGVGCGSTGPTQNDYTCNGFCNGEPLQQLIIQAPDPNTACTEYVEYCMGAGTCTGCS